LIASGALIAVGATASVIYLTPRQAAEKDSPMQTLSAAEKATLQSFGEVIVPGSTVAGMVHFLDSQLAQDPNDCMLILKYFQIRPPYVSFYSAGCAALDAHCQAVFARNFVDLSKPEKAKAVEALVGGKPQGWPEGPKGPPAFLFYMFVRSDGVDVVYGMPDVFEKLEVPYMEHILPPEGWVA